MSEEGKRQEKKGADDPEAGRRAGCRKAKDKPGSRGGFGSLCYMQQEQEEKTIGREQ